MCPLVPLARRLRVVACDPSGLVHVIIETTNRPAVEVVIAALEPSADAIAHVRGGGENGEEWYKAGYKATKPNTWKDGIAVPGLPTLTR